MTASPPPSAAPPLTRAVMVAFGVGSLAESMTLLFITSFGLLFYNQVRGAPAHLVGLAFSASLVLNAVCDPLIGSWSDRTRSRLGRRHPFMYAAIIPTAASFFAIFNPPSGLGHTGELIWLCVFNIVFLQSMALFHTPHLALGGELSADYAERAKVMSYNTFCLAIGGSLGWWLSLAVFFRPSPQFPNGALDATRWPPFTLAAVTVIVLGFFTSAWFTRSRIPYLPRVRDDAPRISAAEFLRDAGRALSNRSYRSLAFGFLFQSLMNGMRGGLWMYGATFFWRLTSTQISLFVISTFIGYSFGSLAIAPILRRFDKPKTGFAAALVLTVGPALPLTLGWLGVLTSETPYLLAILIGFQVLEHAPQSLLTTTVYSALADIADENELRYGLRQEGLLFALRTFFAKLDQALGTILAGWALTLIAFPPHAVPGRVPPGVLHGLAAAFMLTSVAGLVSAYFYGTVGITRRSHARTRAALDARAADAAGALTA